MSTLTICLVIFVVTIIGFATAGKRYSITAVALGSMILMVLTKCLKPATALSCFSNANVILMASMFVVSAGLNKTQMINKITAGIVRMAKGSFQKILVGYVLLAVIMISFIPSVMVTITVVIPLAAAVCRELKVSPSKLLFPIALAGIGSCMVIPTNMVVTQVAQINGYFEAYNYTVQMMTMKDFIICRLPGAIAVLIMAIFVVPRMATNHQVDDEKKKKKSKTLEVAKLDPVREVIGYATFILVLLGLMFSSKIGIPTWVISTTGALVLAFSGVLKKDEIISSMNLSMVLLFVGSLGIGNALSETGVSELIGSKLSMIVLATKNNYLAGLILFLVPFILTQFMMNNGVGAIFQPLYVMLAQSLGCNPIGILMLATTAFMTSFLTPMATPAIAVVMGMGNYSQRDLLKMGIIPAAFVTVCVVFVTMTLYPIF